MLHNDNTNTQKFKNELTLIYNDIINANFYDVYQIKETFFRLIRFNEMLITELEEQISNNIQ